MTTKKTSPTKAATKTVKLGDVVDLGGTFVLRLPDGTVVTGRGSYLPRHPGTYVATVDGQEREIEVA